MSRRAIIGALAVTLAAACPAPRGRLSYVPAKAPPAWCEVGAGAYAYLWYPTTRPSLAGDLCEQARVTEHRAGTSDPKAPNPPPPPSTLAELVVVPGGAIELPVQLPPALLGAGCLLDSVVIAHAKTSTDLAIEIRAGDAVIPIVHYEDLPPPPPPAALPALAPAPDETPIYAPDPPRDSSGALIDPAPTQPAPTPAPPTPSPFLTVTDRYIPYPPAAVATSTTGPGGTTGTGATTEIELEVALGGWHAGVTLTLDADSRASDDRAGVTVGPPAPPEFLAIRHSLGGPAPDAFSIVLRAGARPFGIAVRSDRESRDPTLSYRAPTADALLPTHLVPQAAVILTHCRRPASDVLDAIDRPR